MHEIDTRDHLGDGVLDLQARIHLHEVVLAVFVHQEFEGADALIADGEHGLDGTLAHLVAGGVAEVWAWRLFEQLLVAALHGAVALTEVDAVAVRVAEHLQLDVSGTARDISRCRGRRHGKPRALRFARW